jgi:hypothetical protein
MILLVCGGRDYNDWPHVYRVLWRVAVTYGVSRLVHGAARGADSLAAHWAAQTGVKAQDYPANWYPDGKTLDRGAGHKRNQLMLDMERPDIVVAFPGGPGTANMVDRAIRFGTPIVIKDTTRWDT